MKIYGLKEETEAVVLYFTAEKRVPLKDLARDLEFEFNVPIRLKQLPKNELGKIGKTDVLGNLGCCATFSPHCLFKDKYGCGYGFGGVSEYQSVKVSKKEAGSDKKEPVSGKTGEAPPKPKKKKKRKMIRRLVIK